MMNTDYHKAMGHVAAAIRLIDKVYLDLAREVVADYDLLDSDDDSSTSAALTGWKMSMADYAEIDKAATELWDAMASKLGPRE